MLTGGAIQVFVSNRATYAFNEGLRTPSRERPVRARFARAITCGSAGYFGCLSGRAVVQQPEHADDVAVQLRRRAPRLRGASARIPARPSRPQRTIPRTRRDGGGLDAGATRRTGGSVIPGSDVLVIRHVSAAVVYALEPILERDGQLPRTRRPPTIREATSPSCRTVRKSSIFQVTSVANVGRRHRRCRHVGEPARPATHAPSWDTDQEYAAGRAPRRAARRGCSTSARAPGGGPAGAVPAAARSSTPARRRSVDARRRRARRSRRRRCRCATASTPHLDGAIEQYVTANNVANWDEVAAVRVAIVDAIAGRIRHRGRRRHLRRRRNDLQSRRRPPRAASLRLHDRHSEPIAMSSTTTLQHCPRTSAARR